MSTILSLPFANGLTNDDFLKFTNGLISGEISDDSYEKAYRNTMMVNLRRFEGLADKLEINEDILHEVRDPKNASRWLLINEPWCLDGSFVQPLLQKIADASAGNITLRILLRDQHPEVMDMFLTNGGRAIPKLILLSNQNEVLGTWGPRPFDLQNIVTKMILQPGFNSNEKIKTVTRWYIKDKSRQIQSELLDLIINRKA